MNVFDYSAYALFKWSDMRMILNATLLTIRVTLISLALGTALGLVLGLIRCAKNRALSSLPLIIMEPLRNSPLIVQLFLVYYGLPSVGIRFDAYTAAILTLSLNTSAFFAVLVQSSIQSIPKAQWEAGYALGHNKGSVYVRVIAMQAFRLLIPQAITLYISQLQCSSLVSLVSLMDLTKAGQIVAQKTLLPFLVFGIVAAIYYIVSFPLARLSEYLERRTGFNY
ncbi:MAG: amino acid ABC transporter permease [Clostridiales bacterium]|jgi:His/Glu/Gln/Arg/opine family amino acid ABC transporter permease subunit|nr:amino acid ABC transporter permease [Clostridiales bacterium]